MSSVNQSRRENNQPPHYRRPSRYANPNSPRNFTAGQSFKKAVSNAHGQQAWVSVGTKPNQNASLGSSNSSQHGARIQQPLRATSGTSVASSTGDVVKPIDASVQKSTPGLPKAPQSNVVPLNSGTTDPSTPAKGPADASKEFSLQFGSISPGVIKGMQVPARTSSAPTNLDKQKETQARHDSFKATPLKNAAVPKQRSPRKDSGIVDKPREARSVSKEKKEVLSSLPGPVAAHAQKSTGSFITSIPPGVSMQMPFHPQVHPQFSGPNPPLQSQSLANTSLPMPLPMHLPVGNPPPQVQQQVFVSGIQHHLGIIHQNPGLTFSSQMGPRLGNMGGVGMGLGSQYQQQPMSNLNFGGAKTIVNMIHPDTQVELQLNKRTDGYLNGGSPGQKSHPPQSQAIPPAAPPMNFFSSSYNAGALLPLPSGSKPLTNNAQMTRGSQPPRFHNQASKQVSVKQPVISSHAEKVVDSMHKSKIPNKSQRKGQPHKDSETISGQIENLTNTSAVVAKFAKNSLVGKEAACQMIGEQGGQETSKPSMFPVGIGKDVSETSNRSEGPSKSFVDLSASKCDDDEKSLNSTQVNGNTPKGDVEVPIAESEGSKDQVKESVKPNQDNTVLDATVAPLKEHVDDIEDNSLGSNSTSANVDVLSAETSSMNLGSSHDDNKEDILRKFDVDQVNGRESFLITVPEASALTLEVEATDLISPSSGKVKGHTTAKGKKKIKEILKNADARGTTSDLYNAYKRSEEKKETAAAEIFENPNPSINSTSGTNTVLSSDKKCAGPTKFEPDDWEDAADISAPKMDTELKLKHHSEDDNDGTTKKYSRDFLLKFSYHCTDLPEGFKITHITEVLVVTGVNMAREFHPSLGRGGADISVVGSRLDRQPSNVGLDDKWNKGSGGPMGPGWDPRLEIGYLSRGNHGMLRSPRGQLPSQYAGSILSGPIPLGPQLRRNNSESERWQLATGYQKGLMSPLPQLQRNNSESERWQRSTGYQKGLMPHPHTPMMHKAEKKYEVGKVTDEEQAKQRQLKSILNRLTPQNFEKLFDQVKQVNIDNANTLSGVIGQIFDKALMEPTFVEMYANFCSHLAAELPGFVDNNEKITFKRLLLNKCQEEFERGEREEEEANRTDEEGEIKQTEEQREEKRVKARRRMLGNIRFIGELYKKRMLTERIMHECINKLLGFNQKNPNPDEEDIEALCKLMSTIGEMIDHQKAKEHMDVYFDTMFQLSINMALSSRVRFMLKDAIDLRKNKWQQRRKVEGPKKIEEVHRDAAQERQAQSSILARGPNSNPSLRRASQTDFGPKGSAGVLSTDFQMGGGFRGLPQQLHGYGIQDSRFDYFENRTLPVPSRPMFDEAITLGPQGGLARGMSVMGQPFSMQGIAGPNNGYGSSMIQERRGYGTSRADLSSRYLPLSFSPRPGYDPRNIQEHNSMNYGNRDSRNIGRGGFDRVPPAEGARVSTPPQSDPSDKILSEDRLHDMSIETIKEFYSARDEKEVALCIKDLNAPGFYPSMISIWVTDSFERNDRDRDLLAKLLINLTKSQEGILTQDSLVRGLESILSTLEDAVNDAPKAAEFLGRMLARILMENVIPYKEVWRLIHEGGDKQGRLVEIGLAAEVVGVILETIKSEKGEPFLNEMRAASNLRVEVFRSSKTSRLDKFI